MYKIRCGQCAGVTPFNDMDSMPKACPLCGFSKQRAPEPSQYWNPNARPVPFDQVLTPAQVSKDARENFTGRGDRMTRDHYYAEWAAYDASLEGMMERQRVLQQRAEVLELERLFAVTR